MSIFNDHINLVDIKRPINDVLEEALFNPIKINHAIISKGFDKSSILKYFPNINFKYIEQIDEMYTKYVKYKSKYLSLKNQLGDSYVDLMKMDYQTINEYFSKNDVCTIEDISIYRMFFLSDMHGITRGYGGAYLLAGMVESVECVFKLFKIFEKGIPDKNINEIGLTHYISDYFLNHPNQKITDNFVTFFHNRRCEDFLLKDYPLSTSLSEKIPEEDITSKDINIMIVEKVTGDLGGFLKSFLVKKTEAITPEKEKNVIEFFDSVFFQIIYTLYVFEKEFKGFVHGDLHLGNILIKADRKPSKKYKISRVLDPDDPDDVTDFDIEVQTFGITPKIWDFATSVVGTANNNIKENNLPFMNKYFAYRNENKLLTHEYKKNTDLQFLLSSIKLLGMNYHLPNKYIEELDEIFTYPINKIFNIFLNKIIEKYENTTITKDNSDFYFMD
jgi:hypothetical protein